MYEQVRGVPFGAPLMNVVKRLQRTGFQMAFDRNTRSSTTGWKTDAAFRSLRTRSKESSTPWFAAISCRIAFINWRTTRSVTRCRQSRTLRHDRVGEVPVAASIFRSAASQRGNLISASGTTARSPSIRGRAFAPDIDRGGCIRQRPSTVWHGAARARRELPPQRRTHVPLRTGFWLCHRTRELFCLSLQFCRRGRSLSSSLSYVTLLAGIDLTNRDASIVGDWRKLSCWPSCKAGRPLPNISCSSDRYEAGVRLIVYFACCSFQPRAAAKDQKPMFRKIT